MTDSYTALTRGVRVTVRAMPLPDQSNPAEGRWAWAYRIEIRNEGRETVRLLKRTWHITDGLGRVQMVHGEGVVGETPILDPGEAFTYTSGTPLGTPSGFMRGAYHMVATDSGERFDVEIPAFSLDSADARRTVN